MPKRSWRRKTMQSSIETGEPQYSDPAFKLAVTMTLLIWTLGGLAIRWRFSPGNEKARELGWIV